MKTVLKNKYYYCFTVSDGARSEFMLPLWVSDSTALGIANKCADLAVTGCFVAVRERVFSDGTVEHTHIPKQDDFDDIEE